MEMKKISNAVVMALLVFSVIRCGKPSGGTTLGVQGDTSKAKFTYVGTVFQKNCMPCHSVHKDPKTGETRQPAADLDLTTYALVTSTGDDVITPGSPADSVLYVAVKSKQMPPREIQDKYPALTTTDVQAIGDWITGGAQNN